jgi:hypothetical protein
MSDSALSESSTITQNRRELKFKLGGRDTARFAAGVAARIPYYRYLDRGANHLPRARQYITTVYFDTVAREVYRAVRDNPNSLKIRAREYYHRHPELLDLATSTRDIVRSSAALWFEIKGKRDGRTYKRRVSISKQDIQLFFERGIVSATMRGLHSSSPSEPDLFAELCGLRERFCEALRASCIVNYRRTAFEDPAGTLRITFDQHIACFAPFRDLWSSGSPLVRETLGTPVYEEPCYIVEVKARAELPLWLTDLVERLGAEPHAFSKFATASESVHGPLPSLPRHGCVAR